MAIKSESPPKHRTIGENVQAAREAKGISQLALAHAMGWKGDDAGAHLCRIENNKAEPRVSTLRLIARALGVPVEQLLPA
jgi:transcriptional regulator with XRE-family HTH domain